MSLEGLPTELLDAIFDLCSLCDTKSLRLASKCLRVVADGHLFKELVCFYNTTSLKIAEDIGNAYPQFRKGIRSFCFYADRLEKIESFDAWKKDWEMTWPTDNAGFRRDVMPMFEEIGKSRDQDQDSEQVNAKMRETIQRINEIQDSTKEKFTIEQLHERYAHYCDMIESQTTTDSDDTIRSSLTPAFKATRVLTEISVTTGNTLRVTPKHRQGVYKKGLITAFGDPNVEHQCVHALTQVLLAAHDAKVRPRNLSIGNASHSFLIQDQEIMRKVYQVLESVEEFNWIIATPFAHDDSILLAEVDKNRMVFRDGAFLRFIANAQNLRKLDIEMPFDDNWEGDVRTDLEGVVGDLVFPRLETLTLYYAQTKQDTLVDLLLRHSRTLKKLRLVDLRLTDAETWIEVFQAFGGRLPAIQDVELRGRFDDTSGIVDYVFSPHADSREGNGCERDMVRYIKGLGGHVPYWSHPPGLSDSEAEGEDSEDSSEQSEESEESSSWQDSEESDSEDSGSSLSAGAV